MDRPHEYGLHRVPIPYSVGIVFPLVFIVSVFLFVDITKPIAGVIFAAFLVAVVSFMDDRVRLSPLFRLCVQILAGVIIIFAGIKIQLIKNPFGAPIMLDSISFNLLGQQIWLFSSIAIVVWLVLMMNVMNWLDGIPGLSSGISTIAQISLFILSTRQFNIVDQSAIITISSVLAASTFAFLFFDFYPPKLLMGDTGSMFLGLMLGVLSILAGGKLATALLIMGFPVIDAFWVIIGRMIKKGSPLKGDYSHFHHQLLKVGFSEKRALIFNYFFCVIFAGIALVLSTTFAKAIAFVVVFLAMGVIRIGVSLKVSK
ncbi:undecaprenyl/decaprenyl-phosphate alpha-N-acetylglucosaminyl 1-phosphate transferase [Candidatus Peregrinibacteria bacterium]|nr:undecaprenyl/decaprenyl-phosphate alpha-N-acetylglucosaminyl 1-phosphate transferase [Candidatus Peregrinibacteria bacterium]